MRRFQFRFLVRAWAAVVLLLLSAGPVRADEPAVVLDVWPGKAVGDHGTIGPERVRTASEAPTKDATWITDVTRPTIKVFRPPARHNARAAVVICPGGGYWNLAWDKEGEEVAAWLNTLGVTGVVLKYRVPRRPGEPEPLPAPGPLLDAQRAIRLVRGRAAEWGIEPQRIGIMGFSAGGHLAVMSAIAFEKPAYAPIDEVDRASCRPDFAVVAYPGYILSKPGSGVLADYLKAPRTAPPMFLAHASDDDERGAQPEQSLALYRVLREAGVPVELHIYERGGHGFGVRRTGRATDRWTDQCAAWLKQRGLLGGETGETRAAGHPAADGSTPARHDRLPRKVVVGTTMTRWYSDYPGLHGRLEQMRGLIDEMAAEARRRHGRSLDLALFSEYAVTAGKPGAAAAVAVPLDATILEALGSKAREHHTHIVFGGVFREGPDAYVNAAAVIDRRGRLLGRYVKVHPVLEQDRADGKIVLEGGVKPGTEYNTFDLDFGRIGVQICYDVEYPEGWRRLGERGVDLLLYPTQSPQLTRPGMYAARHEYWVVSSTFRNNASIFEPGTGLVAAQINEPKQTLVRELDLSYAVLPWSTRLRNGQAFREAFGDKVGYHYSESEDRGVFWSNDPAQSIGQMARSLGLMETTTEATARAGKAQDQLRGGPAR